jgi:hypothetical protein
VQAGVPVAVTYTVTAAAPATWLVWVEGAGNYDDYPVLERPFRIPCTLQPALPRGPGVFPKSYTGSCTHTYTFSGPVVRIGGGPLTYGASAAAYVPGPVHYPVVRAALQTLTVTLAPPPSVSLEISPSTVQANVPATVTFTVTAAAATPLIDVAYFGHCVLPPVPANSTSYRGSCSYTGSWPGGTWSYQARATALGAGSSYSAPQTLTSLPPAR